MRANDGTDGKSARNGRGSWAARHLGALVALGGLLTTGVVVAEAPKVLAAISSSGSNSVKLVRGSRLWLEGDSTLHKFSSEASQLQVAFTTDDTVQAAAGAGGLEALVKAGGLKSLVFKVPVITLKSGESGLDDNLVKALNGKEHPAIQYRLDSYEIAPAGAPGAQFAMKMKGHLSIAGVEKDAEVVAQVHRTDAGLRLVGSKDLKMTDFGVKPPVLMMGMIKVADPVSVKFDLQLQSGSAQNGT